MKALLLVDIQEDFLPGGSLAVPAGDEIISLANDLMKEFELIIATQDWHPANHSSFAANHRRRNIGDVISLDGLSQILWPVHCVQDSPGAKLADGMDTSKIQHIIKKGTDKNIDSYSGFYDNGHKKATGLSDYLKKKFVTEVTICGLATDYCVKFTALDACALGFETKLAIRACRGVNLKPEDVSLAIREMKEAGVKIRP